MGGLIHRMPVTSFAFLIGCVAISALPPLNGFASEWLIFQAILQSPVLPQWGLKIMLPAVGGLLAFSAALVAACFVRAFGTAFLGRPRTPVCGTSAEEVDRCSLAAMLGLVALCVLIGILPGFVIDSVSPVTQELLGARMPAQADIPWLSIVPITQSCSSYNGLLVLLFIAFSASLAALCHPPPGLARGTSRSRLGLRFPGIRPRRCNTPPAASREAVPPGLRHPGIPRPRAGRNAVAGRHASGQIDRLRCATSSGTLSMPRSAPAIGFAADHLNRLQFLTIRRYLSLVFLSLVTLLLVLTLWF